MKAFGKVLSSVIAALLISGLVLLLVGVVLGGSFRSIRINWQNGMPRITYSNVTADATDSPDAPDTPNTSAANVAAVYDGKEIKNLSVEVAATGFTIVQGDTFSITGGDNYTMEVNGATLEVEKGPHWDMADNLTLTIPRDVSFEKIELNVGAGALSASGLRGQKVTIEVDAGSISLTDFSATQSTELDVGTGNLSLTGTLSGKVSADVGMGNLSMSLAPMDEYGYDISVGMGSVTLGPDAYRGLGKDAESNPDSANFFDLSCDMGRIAIKFS